MKKHCIKDTESFSYVAPLSTNTWLLAIDCNTDESIGTVKKATLKWMEKVLKEAQKNNIHVISMTHQNVLEQSSLMSSGFVISNHKEVQELLEKYNVTLNLSGHSHLQHTASTDQLTDICTGSVTVSPLRYGYIEISNDGTWSYEKKNLGILKEEAKERFADTVVNQVNKELSALDIPEQKKSNMISFAVEANAAYFSGETNFSSLKQDERWHLWNELGTDTFWYSYIKNFLDFTK